MSKKVCHKDQFSTPPSFNRECSSTELEARTVIFSSINMWETLIVFFYHCFHAAVVEFSKKTGDYASLSPVDLKVLALTLTFERENNGKDHLRDEPLRPKQVCSLLCCERVCILCCLTNICLRGKTLARIHLLAIHRDSAKNRDRVGGIRDNRVKGLSREYRSSKDLHTSKINQQQKPKLKCL